MLLRVGGICRVAQSYSKSKAIRPEVTSHFFQPFVGLSFSVKLVRPADSYQHPASSDDGTTQAAVRVEHVRLVLPTPPASSPPPSMVPPPPSSSSATAPASRILVAASPNSPGRSPFSSKDDLKSLLPASSSANRLRALQQQGPPPAPSSGSNAPHSSGNNDNADDSRGSFRSWKRFEGLEGWEKDLVDSHEVKRKANVAQLCE